MTTTFIMFAVLFLVTSLASYQIGSSVELMKTYARIRKARIAHIRDIVELTKFSVTRNNARETFKLANTMLENIPTDCTVDKKEQS